MSAAPAIVLENLTLAYRRHPAVHHLSGAFPRGSLTAVVGPNGAGKSSLLAALMGQLRPTTGNVRIDPALADAIAWLPQQAAIEPGFPIRVQDVVGMGLWRECGAFGGLSVAQRERISAALAATGLFGFEPRMVGELSVGQLQRCLFARILLQDAPLILLDEPFNAIDARTTETLLGLIRQWHEEGRTLVVVLHDLEMVRRHFPSTLLLARELIAWGDTAQALSELNLRRARVLADHWVEDAAACAREGVA